MVRDLFNCKNPEIKNVGEKTMGKIMVLGNLQAVCHSAVNILDFFVKQNL